MHSTSSVPAWTFAELNAVCIEVLAPAHFYVAAPHALHWELTVRETVPWEIVRSRLLDRQLTRQQQTLIAWNVYLVEAGSASEEPLLALKLDAREGVLHIVRGLLCHAWEACDVGGGVIESRERERWLRELVGSIDLHTCADMVQLRRELQAWLHCAVVGLSRLPLTSVETPLPGFTLGQLAYWPHPSQQLAAQHDWRCQLRELLPSAWHLRGLAELYEWLLRTVTPAELREAADELKAHAPGPVDEQLVLRRVLNDTTLSPYTGFVANLLGYAAHNGPGFSAELGAHILRQLGRHLTAYDLVTFHHRGANYPDALLLAETLDFLADIIARHSELFLDGAEDNAGVRQQKRLRRRGVRQGLLLRALHAQLPVPEIPTSPGEAARVLPAAYPRVPEEQIHYPGKRPRRLFAEPFAPLQEPHFRAVWLACLHDLHEPLELRELGMALFLDRPLSFGKVPGEPDGTPLLTYEAFSRSLARARLDLLAQHAADLDWSELRARLTALAVPGVPAQRWAQGEGRVVSLVDAARVAEDFVILACTRQSSAAFLKLFAGPAAEGLFPWHGSEKMLLVPTAAPHELEVCDQQLQRRLLLRVDLSEGYRWCCGVELPRAGLQILGAWIESGQSLTPLAEALLPRWDVLG